MQIAYTAHTETCTLLLDGDGICRSVLALSSAAAANGRNARPARIPASAEKCIGAQYVATLDLSEPGGMGQLPKPGAQMLFARTESSGRITLVRSAPVLRFESAPNVAESGVHARPSERAAAPVRYGDDDEPTIADPIPSFAPASPAPRERTSSIPPVLRTSGVVPVAQRTGMTKIPPPPPMPRFHAPDSETRPIMAARLPPPALPNVPSVPPPKRPSLVRVSAPEWDHETRPFRRAAR